MQRNLRESVLEIFGECPDAAAQQKLASVSIRDWKKLLDWMDASGIALYFLARITEIGASHYLPAEVLGRLQRDLRDNRERHHKLSARVANERYR